MQHNQVFEGHHNEGNSICIDWCSSVVEKVDILINNKAVHLKARLTQVRLCPSLLSHKTGQGEVMFQYFLVFSHTDIHLQKHTYIYGTSSFPTGYTELQFFKYGIQSFYDPSASSPFISIKLD